MLQSLYVLYCVIELIRCLLQILNGLFQQPHPLIATSQIVVETDYVVGQFGLLLHIDGLDVVRPTTNRVRCLEPRQVKIQVGAEVR